MLEPQYEPLEEYMDRNDDNDWNDILIHYGFDF